jgi:hypothetical protein
MNKSILMENINDYLPMKPLLLSAIAEALSMWGIA